MFSDWLPYDNTIDQYARNEIKNLMRMFLLIIPSVAIVLSTVNFIYGQIDVAMATLGVPVFCLLAWHYLNRGHMNISMIMITSIMIIVTSVICFLGARVHEVGIIIFPVIVFFASLVMNVRGVIVTITAVSLCLALLVFGEQYHVFPSQTHARSWVDLLVVLSVLLIHVFMTFSFSGVTRDSLKKVQMELENQRLLKDEIAENLTEKTELLRLVHHRVKNNLLLVNSLIELEAYERPAMKSHLKEVTDSIYTIARAHDPLYHTDDYKQVSIKPYLEKSLASFVQSHTIKGLEIHLEDCLIFHEKALLLGIILQKSMSAIDRLESMILEIELKYNDDLLQLKLSSLNQKPFKFSDKSLIQLLIKQIGGTVEINSNGLIARISL